MLKKVEDEAKDSRKKMMEIEKGSLIQTGP